MKTHFTLEERIHGINSAFLWLYVFIGGIGLCVLLLSFVTLNSLNAEAAIWFLVISFFVTLISCQIGGHFIWYIGNQMGLKDKKSAVIWGAITGGFVGTFWGSMLNGQITILYETTPWLAAIGAICGLTAFNKADELRQLRA